MAPTIHQFPTTGEAYDTSQWNSAIHDGDVLFVPSEGVYGFLFEAWPIAVTKAHGEFHGPAVDRRPATRDEWVAAHPAYAESWDIAAGWAIAEKHEILPYGSTTLVDDLGVVPTSQLDPALTAGQPEVTE
jgi:hypothetical protein